MICNNKGFEVLFWFFFVIVFVGALNWLWVAIYPANSGGFVVWIVNDKGGNKTIWARIIFGAVGVSGIFLLIVAIMCAILKCKA